jgi:UDP-3-O-[3-hydroxymyristoyl] glucosamine N-acyltransferase
MTCTAGELAGLLQGDLRGQADLCVANGQTLEKAGPNDIVYVMDSSYLRKLRKSEAGIALLPRSLANDLTGLEAKTLIFVDDPQGSFLRVLERLRPRRPRSTVGVSPDAHVTWSAVIGDNTNIHPGAIIGEDVVIGKNCDIHSGAVIGPGCRLGDDVTLFPNVVLYHDIIVGNRVAIHAGAVIGADGFGYRVVNGRHQKLPHYGNVRIDDDVEIGACTTIDRAMIGTTVIGAGTKIDNLVQIAHNCELGQHNLMAAQVGFAGSSSTGNYVVCAGQVGVGDHVHLADRCILGAKAAVHKNMGSETYLGMPALPEAEAIRLHIQFRKLPELRDQVKELTARLDAITKQMESKAA